MYKIVHVKFVLSIKRFLMETKMKFAFTFSSALILLLLSLSAGVYATELDGKLVFSDDFNGDSLRKYFWDFEDGCEEVRHRNMAHECFMSEKNLQVANGTLILRAGSTHFDGRVMYTSARVRGSGFGFKYGTMAVRARMPAGKHLLPAMYLLPINQHQDRCKYEEIDILEYRGERTSSLVFSTKFGQKYNQVFTRSTEKSFAGTDFSKDFHTFVIKWVPTRIEWYVDGVKVHEVNTHFISDWTQGKRGGLPCWKRGQLPFGDKSSLFLSLTVGGELFKDSKYGNLTEDEASAWPKPYLEIDWVRVYNNENEKNGIAPSILNAMTTTTMKPVKLPNDYTQASTGNTNQTQNIVVTDYLAPFTA